MRSYFVFVIKCKYKSCFPLKSKGLEIGEVCQVPFSSSLSEDEMTKNNIIVEGGKSFVKVSNVVLYEAQLILKLRNHR